MTLVSKPVATTIRARGDGHKSPCKSAAEMTFAALKQLSQAELFPFSDRSLGLPELGLPEVLDRLRNFEPDCHAFPREACGRYARCRSCDFDIQADIDRIVRDVTAAAETKGREAWMLVCTSRRSS